MSSRIALKDLIEALAGAVIEAQDRIEQHQIANLGSYFDENNRPKSVLLRLPSLQPGAQEGSEDLYRAPLLPLVATNMLRIKDVEISFDVDLGALSDEEAAAAPGGRCQHAVARCAGPREEERAGAHPWAAGGQAQQRPCGVAGRGHGADGGRSPAHQSAQPDPGGLQDARCDLRRPARIGAVAADAGPAIPRARPDPVTLIRGAIHG